MNMGKDLDRKSRGHRFRIVIAPGATRPSNPVLASMYATACSIAVKEVVPLFTHFKLYKDRDDIYQAFSGHVSVSFVSLASSS